MGSSESFKLEPILTVKKEDDGYAASVIIREVDPTTDFLTTDVTDYLRRHSVVFGFELKAINEVVKKIKTGPVNTSIQVARGKKPVEGKDGREEFRFRTQLIAGSQTEQKTDYRERGLVNNVRPGQVIAVIEKEIPGKPGITVEGNKIETLPVKCVKIPKAGLNVESYTEDRKTTYTAMIAGHARKLFNEIQVAKDFIVIGDLDYTKGNIDFVGNVGITGDVKSGFTVRAEGDISIGGNVEPNAVISAGKNIVVNNTIRCGMGNGLFEVAGDITAKTVLNSKIFAKGNIFVKELVSDSELFCEGKFASSWGTILGSTIEAIGGINVNNVGKNDSLAKTTIYSGRSILSEERQKKIEDELLNLRNELQLIAKKVSVERESNEATLDARERDRIKQLGIARTKHVKQINERIAELEELKQNVQKRLCVNYEATMVVRNKIYPTSLLCNGANKLTIINSPKAKVTLEYSDEEVKESPIE